jgi:hypothetical protein
MPEPEHDVRRPSYAGGSMIHVNLTERMMMFSRMLTHVGAGVALAAALTLGSGAAAYAHECYNPSRSDQGDAKAGANSQAWFTLVVADAIQGDAGSGMITQQQADCIKAAYAATGSPSSFTVLVKGAVGQNGVIAAHNPHSEHAADGKGIDHLFPAYGQQILGSYAACGVQF